MPGVETAVWTRCRGKRGGAVKAQQAHLEEQQQLRAQALAGAEGRSDQVSTSLCACRLVMIRWMILLLVGRSSLCSCCFPWVHQLLCRAQRAVDLRTLPALMLLPPLVL